MIEQLGEIPSTMSRNRASLVVCNQRLLLSVRASVRSYVRAAMFSAVGKEPYAEFSFVSRKGLAVDRFADEPFATESP